MPEYLLGIDNGSTVSKVLLFDLHGREVASASQPAPLHFPQAGWVERDMGLLWQSTAAAIRNALASAAIAPAQIAAIGLCGHGNGLYLLDKEGSPLRPALASTDTRAAAIVAAWQADGTAAEIWPRTLQQPYAGQPPALLRWLKLYEPATYARIGTLLLAKDYIRYCLTGTLATDCSDIGVTSLMDQRAGRYNNELLAAYGISEMAAALPPVLASTALAGMVSATAARETGLTSGTPVVAGMFDVSACALGSGVLEPGQLCIVAGTWSINGLVSKEPLADRRLFLDAPYTPERWLTIEASPTSATNLEWFVREFCAAEQAEAERRGISPFAVCGERVAELPAGAGGVIFHPFLYGSNQQPGARAGFYGLGGWHTRAHVLRAVFEGVAFSHLSHIEKLREAGAQPLAGRLSGGAARSPIWAQIFADTLGLPIEVLAGEEFGARGAALCAGIGIGMYRTFEEAAVHSTQPEREYRPDPAATSRYRAIYSEYLQLAEAMRSSWERGPQQ
jgi:L-xylulokinase